MMTQSRWGMGRGTVEPQRIQAADMVVVGLDWLYGLSQATTNTIGLLNTLARAHANAKRDSTEFADSIQSGLESLDVTDEEDQT